MMTRKLLHVTATLLLAAVFLFFAASPATALVIGPQTTETTAEPDDELTPAQGYVYEHLTEWQDQLIVSEYTVREANVLQIYLVVPSLAEEDIDMLAFSDAFFNMLDAEELDADRVYLDIIDEDGVRLESYDLVPATQDLIRAVFGDDSEEPEPDPEPEPTDDPDIDAEPAPVVEVGAPFVLGDNTFVITGYNLEEDYQGEYLLITFDYTNNTGSSYSAFMAGDYEARQNGELLDRVYSLDDLSTTYKDIEDGETITDCLLGFYIDGDAPVTVQFDEFLGDDSVSYVFEIDGVG